MSQLKTRRLFIAVAIPDNIREYLAESCEKLKKTGGDAKWVEEENIHLTLKFLGATEEAKIPLVSRAIETACSGIAGFTAALESIGGFPSLTAPRVLWASLKDPEGYFSKIASRLEDNLVKLGFEKENRTFKNHMTLARVRSQRNRLSLVQSALDLQKNIKPMSFFADNVTLFESKLSPKGPTYLVVKKIDLKR